MSKLYAKEGRLADVLALIQILALDEESSDRGEKGLMDELQGSPTSSKTWTDLAEEHPEFFRVRRANKFPVSLTARHVMPRENGRRKVLPNEFVYTLLKTAIDLHDHEEKRWRIPLWVAIITAVGVVINAAIQVLAKASG